MKPKKDQVWVFLGKRSCVRVLLADADEKSHYCQTLFIDDERPDPVRIGRFNVWNIEIDSEWERIM